MSSLRFNSNINPNTTVREIVAADIRKAEALRSFGIDFSCGGEHTLSDACRSAGADLKQVKDVLGEINTADLLPSQNCYYWDAGFLCDYIVKTHHLYSRRAKETLLEYASQMKINHGKNHPELGEVEHVLITLFDELMDHMHKEETEIFPVIKNMAEAYNHPDQNLVALVKGAHLLTPYETMEKEHENVGGVLHHLRKLTSDYQDPPDACLTYKVYYAKLKEFDDDLCMHIHLENNILIPKAKQLSEKFNI